MANERIRVPYGADGQPMVIIPPVGYAKTSDNPGGYANNDFEGTVIQTDFKVIDQISVTGGDTDIVLYDSIVSTKGKWVVGAKDLQWDGANWIYDNGTETWTHATATGTFPDKIGWPLGSLGSAAIVLDYDSYFVENEEFVARSYADDLARSNLAQKLVDQWKKVGGVCLLKERVLYSQGLDETLVWYNKSVRWAEAFTDECGAGITPFIRNYTTESGDNYISEGGDNYIGE